MKHWTLDEIPWETFDPAKVDPNLLKVVKAAAMVERNAADYTTYLGNVFRDDLEFREYIENWREEEEQHGDALGRWAEMADPSFDYKAAFARFVEGFRIQTDVEESIRGSRTGELIARCIVETGTSSFYSALRDAAEEPVLKAICHRIAGDEFRHYKLFYATLKKYQERENIPAWKRFLVAVQRIRESEDDELAFAYHAANDAPGTPYNHAWANLNYAARAFRYYRPYHVERACNMVMKASGLSPQGMLGTLFGKVMWGYISHRAERLGQDLEKQAA